VVVIYARKILKMGTSTRLVFELSSDTVIQCQFVDSTIGFIHNQQERFTVPQCLDPQL